MLRITKVTLTEKVGQLCILLMLITMSSFCFAAENKIFEWSWRLGKTSFLSSTIVIYRDTERLGEIEFSCDLSEFLPSADKTEDTTATIDKVIISSHPTGVLIVTCTVGAHSEQLALIDPLVSTKAAVWLKTGSYFADWEINQGSINLRYDQPCSLAEDSDKESAKKGIKNCEIPFVEVKTQWPIKK